jgi:ribonuclease Z
LAEKYAHSTAAQAAQVAKDAHAKKLMLGHYSARYKDESPLLAEAQAIFPNTVLADEGLVLEV